jgi:hypothetical protein
MANTRCCDEFSNPRAALCFPVFKRYVYLKPLVLSIPNGHEKYLHLYQYASGWALELDDNMRTESTTARVVAFPARGSSRGNIGIP